MHLKCLPNVNVTDTLYSNRESNDWLCLKCSQEIFPFNHYNEDEDFINALNESCMYGSIALLGQLSGYEFNPFDRNDENIDAPLYDSDPDLQYYNDIAYFNSARNCNYYIEQSLKREIETINIDLKRFSLIHLNARSIPKNLCAFEQYLQGIGFRFTVIGISETWLTESNANCYGLNGYQHVYLCRKSKRGGGVSLFINENFTVNVRTDLEIMTDSIEMIFIELLKQESGLDRDVLIGIVYRPPNQSIENFTKLVFERINSLKNENKILYVMGDFNINILNHDDHLPTSDFLESMYSLGIYPMITKPTRVNDCTATLIDNIFTSNLTSSNILNGVLFTNISDHFPIFSINYESKTAVETKSVQKDFIFKKIYQLFLTKLDQLIGVMFCRTLMDPMLFKSFTTCSVMPTKVPFL